MKTVCAKYYNGQTALQQNVTLGIAGDRLKIFADELIREAPLNSIRISSKLGRAPRLLQFADGGHCEINNHADFEALLKEAGLQPLTLLSRLEQGWHHALAATLIALACILASFYWGLPWFADIASAKIPASVTLAIDTHFLETFDAALMQPSQLSSRRQQALKQRFEKLRAADDLLPQALEFRSSKTIGANAFALPGGTIVITDQLVSLAGSDEEIIAVLAHELGHVSERHPLRQLLQSSVVGLAMTWYLGDISSLLAAAPTVLLESSYSRNFERRADLYAARMLRKNHIAPLHLAHILEKLEAAHQDKKAHNEASSRLSELLSSHPDTAERIRDLLNEDALKR